MSPDDSPALVFLLVGATVLAAVKLRRIFSVTLLTCGHRSRLRLLATLGGCGLLLWLALRYFAAREVRESIGYQVMFVAAGMIAVEVVSAGLVLLGLDLVADGVERNNAAARIAFAGLWLAVTISAIGSNLGEGDEIGTTLGPMMLCALGLLAVAFVISAATHGLAPVAIERDRAAGVRLGGLFIASSLPLARAASGDWISTEATLRDFAAALPSLGAIVMVAVATEIWIDRKRHRDPREGSVWRDGLSPAASYLVVVAVTWRMMR